MCGRSLTFRDALQKEIGGYAPMWGIAPKGIKGVFHGKAKPYHTSGGIAACAHQSFHAIATSAGSLSV